MNTRSLRTATVAADPKSITSAAKFLALIEGARNWYVETAPPERDDRTGLVRIIFYLNGDTAQLATVERSHGQMFVCFREAAGMEHNYYFELHRLHEDRQRGWTWQQQIEGKTWTAAQHFALLDELDVVFGRWR